MELAVNITDIWRRSARSWPLAIISLGVVASYSGTVVVVWLLLRLL